MTIEQSVDQNRSFPRFGPDIFDRSIQVIDLTREIFEGMPLWYGHQQTFITTNQTHDQFKRKWGTEFGFEAHNLLLSEHAGTHTDAVFEYNREGPTLDASPLEYYYGEAVCIDVTGVDYPDYIQAADLEQGLKNSGQTLRIGDHFMLYTGYGDKTYPDLAYSERHPGLDRDATRWIAEQGVVNIGIDNVSIDHSDDSTFSAHAVCGEYGIVNTEGLTNLDQLINKRFMYFGLPLKIRAGTGSPIRAVAVLDLL